MAMQIMATCPGRMNYNAVSAPLPRKKGLLEQVPLPAKPMSKRTKKKPSRKGEKQ